MVGAPASLDDSTALGFLSKWERSLGSLYRWAPFVALGLGAVLALVTADDDRTRVILLTVTAGVWTWLTFTRLGNPLQIEQAPLHLYFAGFLLFATLLVLTSTIFLLYGLVGLFHSALLRPWRLAFAGMTGASAIVHSHIVLTESTPTTWAIYLGVVALQTAAVGAGVFGGMKITEIAEERRVALERLRLAVEENEGLHQQLVAQAHEAGILDERQRMAREIHDTIAQGLTGVITQVAAANRSIGDPAELERRLDSAAEIARQSLAEARRSVAELRPAPLDHTRLPDALDDVVAKWTDRAGIPAELHVTGDRRQLPTEVEVALLRAAQEGLANIAKHAQASRAGLTLTFLTDSVALDIRDDGVGMAPERVGTNGGFGLTAMRQRIEQLSGELDVESAPHEGTAVAVRIPTTQDPSDA